MRRLRADSLFTKAASGLAIATISYLVVASAWSQSTPQHNHDQFHLDAYSRWAKPGQSPGTCCHAKITHPSGIVTGDCYPTEFRIGAGGGWVARKDDGTWIDIPDAIVIREKNPDPTGVSGHLCESHGLLHCAVPPTGSL